MKKKTDKNKTALKVLKGVENPETLNTNAADNFPKPKQLTVSEYTEGILKGNITVLSKAITLVESSRPEHYPIAQEIIERCLPYSGNSVRIGVTGIPGVGKSTFIEALGKYLLNKGEKLAVLAIDPSSMKSKGSILGDKTRMEDISASPNTFIRPSPAGETLGGVARKTRETIILCEAAGFKNIFIETVGVGQSETHVYSMVDFFLLLMIAGAGDELQGIKRGIMEMADLVVITKADGHNIDIAEKARIEFEKALHYFPKNESGYLTHVLKCSALEQTGIEGIWHEIQKYLSFTKKSGYFQNKRNKQSKEWMYETINQTLKEKFFHNPDIEKELSKYENLIDTKKITSFIAAKKLIDIFFKLNKESGN